MRIQSGGGDTVRARGRIRGVRNLHPGCQREHTFEDEVVSLATALACARVRRDMRVSYKPGVTIPHLEVRGAVRRPIHRIRARPREIDPVPARRPAAARGGRHHSRSRNRTTGHSVTVNVLHIIRCGRSLRQLDRRCATHIEDSVTVSCKRGYRVVCWSGS